MRGLMYKIVTAGVLIFVLMYSLGTIRSLVSGRQAVSNLFDNALDFILHGGRILLRTRQGSGAL